LQVIQELLSSTIDDNETSFVSVAEEVDANQSFVSQSSTTSTTSTSTQTDTLYQERRAKGNKISVCV
jgi:hypothetical protein